ncbi:MAG: DUF2971 domain-containing protein [Solirubrobacteraceae bacterium]
MTSQFSYHTALGAPGDYFFHYTKRGAAFEDILPRRRLRLSPALRMRDPLESNPAFVLPDIVDVTGLEASDRLQQLRRCSKVLSLTIDARGYDGDAEIFGRGFARARLWEHYAENHHGVCLVLKRDAFHANVLAQLQSRSPHSLAREVRYTPMGIWTDSAATLLPTQGRGGEEAASEHAESHATSLFFTKLMDWESEREYRFVEPSTEDQCTFVDIGDTLAGVIVGKDFPDWQMPSLFTTCDRIGAQPWQMSWDRSIPSPVQISSHDAE